MENAINNGKGHFSLPGLPSLQSSTGLQKAGPLGLLLFFAALGFYPPDLTFHDSSPSRVPSGAPIDSLEPSERVRMGGDTLWGAL